MRYFLVLIEYKTPLENIIRVTEAHRNFLKSGYEKGLLLISGPKIPRTGGLVIAKASDLEEIENFFKDDPYNLNSYADYNFIEFDPKSFDPSVSNWVGKKV
jgi:uncharacterized protein YciI